MLVYETEDGTYAQKDVMPQPKSGNIASMCLRSSPEAKTIGTVRLDFDGRISKDLGFLVVY